MMSCSTAEVDVVVGGTGLLQNAAPIARSPGGDTLIHVHVVLGAGACLPDAQGNSQSSATATSSAAATFLLFFLQVASIPGFTRSRSGRLDAAESAGDDRRRHPLALAKEKWMERGSLRPSSVWLDLDRPEAVGSSLLCWVWAGLIFHQPAEPFLLIVNCGWVLKAAPAIGSRPVASRSLFAIWAVVDVNLAAVIEGQHHRWGQKPPLGKFPFSSSA